VRGRVYYRGQTVIITDSSFITMRESARGFPLRELHQIVIVRGDRGGWKRLRLRPRAWQLRAVYKGYPVVLLESHNLQVFNQVVRAMRRAVEASQGRPV
jgi:hypothetical protein